MRADGKTQSWKKRDAQLAAQCVKLAEVYAELAGKDADLAKLHAEQARKHAEASTGRSIRRTRV